MDEFEKITLKFEGGLASQGKLHFYEFGRSQYAFARFIATIEHFRRTGQVADSIGRSTYVDIIVESPERGSFLESILVPAVVAAGKDFLKARLSGLMSYLWQYMSPRREKTDETITALAKIKLAEEKELTKREKEKTKQLQILREIADGNRATTEKGLDLLKWSMTTSNRAVGRLEIPHPELREMVEELEAEKTRAEEFKDDEDELSQIDESTINSLTSRLRPMIPEVTLPLRRSAKKMYLSSSSSGEAFIFADKNIVTAMTEKRSEEQITAIVGRVKSYDRDARVGKFISSQLPRILNFVVPLSERERLRDTILEAMKRNEVILHGRKVMDQSGMPTSLILIDIVL